MVPRVSIPQVGFIPCSGAGHLCWLNDEALLIGWDQELGTDKTSDNIRLFIYGAHKIFMFVHKKCIHSIHINKFVCVKMQVGFADFAREKNTFSLQEVQLVEVRQMGDGVAMRFAKVVRKLPVPGEVVQQLAQLATW